MLSLCILLLIATAIQVSAQNVTLARDQNTEPEVVGYNIYYRTKNPAFPHSGTSLPEGDSPIFFEDEASNYLPLDLPYDGSIYYFTATAVNEQNPGIRPV